MWSWEGGRTARVKIGLLSIILKASVHENQGYLKQYEKDSLKKPILISNPRNLKWPGHIIETIE